MKTKLATTTDDAFFMTRALELAKKGLGAVSPNPLVGAVLVKDNEVIGEGYHRGYGLAHAEVEAFADAKNKHNDVHGSTLYVTLEPCSHETPHKKTPPCMPVVIGSGVTRVVCAMIDPNPDVSGRGMRLLKRARIETELGCLEKEANELNKGFVETMTKKRPFVAVKIATSLDGKIATKTRESKWITSKESRDSVYRLRDNFDAIIVGRGTVMEDNPRLKGEKTEPLRVILDSKLKTPITAHVYESPKALVFTTKAASEAKIAVFKRAAVDVVVLPEISLKRVLKELTGRGIVSVFIEGGAQVFGSAFDEDVVNRIYWYTAPIIIGGAEGISAVAGEGIKSLKNAKKFRWVSCEQSDEDLLMTLDRKTDSFGRFA